jgi:hypothetical protein
VVRPQNIDRRRSRPERRLAFTACVTLSTVATSGGRHESDDVGSRDT